MDLSAFASALIPGAGEALGAGLSSIGLQGVSNALFGGSYGQSVEDQRWNMLRQTELNRENYQQRYQWTMQDLKKAGLNPILAAQGLTGAFPQAGSPAGPGPNWAPTSAQDLSVMTDIKRSQSETSKNMQDIQESIAQTANLRQRKGLISAQEKQTLQEVQIGLQKVKTMVAQAKAYSAQASLDSARVKTEEERRKEVGWHARLIEKQMKEVTLKLNQLKRIDNVYASEFGKWITYIGETRKALGVDFNVLAGLKGLIPGASGRKIAKDNKAFENFWKKF